MHLIKFIHLKFENIFNFLGHFVYRWRWIVIIICFIITILLSTGFLKFKEINNIRDQFGAENAPSRYEYNVAREFFQELGGLFHLVVAMQASDGGNLLRPDYIDKALEIEEYLQFGLKIEFDGRQLAYSDFCGSQCENSDVVQIFLSLYRNWQQHQIKMEIKTDKSGAAKLTYPSMDIFGNQIYLGNNIFQVLLNNRSGIVESVCLIVLYFPAICPNSTIEQITKRWEIAVLEYSKKTQTDSLVKLSLTSEGLVSEEVRQTGTEVIPLMPVSVVAMILFTVLSSVRADKTSSKGYTALFGLLCPLLSIIASFGLLLLLNFEFLPILMVVPFLVLAIGVDDGFIMLHCWAQTDSKKCVEERCAEMLKMAGPSMSITSLTNFLSFTIGIWTPVPAIRIFCTYVSISVLFAYIFQLFFYTAIMAISGHREALLLKKIYFIDAKEVTEPDKFKNRMDSWLNNFLDFYVNFLLSLKARLIITPILLIYLSISIWGIYHLGIGLTTEKLFHQNSLLLQLYKLQTQVIFKEGGQMQVFVNNPGDMRNKERITEIMLAVKSFESAPGSVGGESTHLWLKTYIPFIGFKENGSMQFQYKYINEYLSLHEYRRWYQFIRLGKQNYCLEERPECIQKFFFSTSFRGAVSWNQKLELIKTWRKIVDKFPLLNLTIYENDSIFADQLLTIPPITIQTVTLALVCMGIVLALFTPSIVIIFVGSSAVLSINMGVFGILYFWNINLDPISMMTTLTAIGVSVDFVAHISFHYYNSGCVDNLQQKQRLKHALQSIGWPMLQAGLSTVLCVVVLAVIDVYIVQVFVKVVFLVVSLGLIHGLLILPIAYSTILSLFDKNDKNKNIRPTKIYITDVCIYKDDTR